MRGLIRWASGLTLITLFAMAALELNSVVGTAKLLATICQQPSALIRAYYDALAAAGIDYSSLGEHGPMVVLVLLFVIFTSTFV